MRRSSAAAIVVAAALLAGCGGHARRAQGGFPACPVRPPAATGRAAVTRPIGTVAVPASPASAQACFYGGASDSPTGRGVLKQATVLDRTLARMLALLLRDGIATGGRRGCVDYPQLVRLRGARGVIASFTIAGCNPAVVSNGQAATPLSQFASNALTSADRLDDGPATITPRFVGRALAAALALARGRHAESVGYVEIDAPGVPFGTVVWQSPLPGAPQDARGFEAALYVATGPSPRCRASQVAGSYFGGERAGGSEFGNIALLNHSARPCAVGGRVRLEPRDGRGRPIRSARTGPAGEDLVLSPRSRPAMLTESSLPPPALIAEFGFSGSQRSDPANGSCDDLARPASWRVTFNGDQHIDVRNRRGRQSFATCGADLGIGDVLRLR